MRPRLRDDVWYVECDEGAYVQGLSGACTLKGKQAYEWLTRLVPYLTGERTLDDLVAGLAADQRAVVEHLVGALYAQCLVVDQIDDQPHLLDADEQSIYAPEIGFIRYGLDSAERRFQRLRETRIALVGEGPVLHALLRAGLCAGWREIQVFAPVADVEVLGGEVSTARRDAKQVVRFAPCPSPVALAEKPLLAEITDRTDLVLHVCGDGRSDASVEWHRADLIALARAAADAKIALGQVLVTVDNAWLTSVGMPSDIDQESCWRRLSAYRPAGQSLSDPSWLTGPVPDIVAGQLALSCFSYLTGLDRLAPATPTTQPPPLTRIDLATLHTDTHQVRAHPLAAPSHQPSRPHQLLTLEELAEPTAVESSDLLASSAGYIDAYTGIVTLLGEDDLVQVPLALCKATVADPYRLLPTWAPAPGVCGWGNDRATARTRTLLAALAVYASLSIDPEATDISGLDLVTGRPRMLPARLVHPVLSHPRVPFRAPTGAAAGHSWSGALTAGLRAWCEQLLGEQLHCHLGGDSRCRDLSELVASANDERASGLLGQLDAIGESVAVIDLSHALSIPAFAFGSSSSSGPPTVVCATTVAEAVRDGLERILVGWQTRTSGQPTPRTSALAWSAEPVVPPGHSPAPSWRPLVDALRRAGRTPVAVPLARDPEARQLLPTVVQVVLCDD